MRVVRRVSYAEAVRVDAGLGRYRLKGEMGRSIWTGGYVAGGRRYGMHR